MDWNNFLNTASNIIKGVGAVAGAVLEGIGEEIYRSYIQLLMNATNNEQYKWTFLTYQIGNGNFLPELPFEGRTQLFDQVYNNMQQGIISSVQDCCSMVSSSTPDLPMRCWNDTVIILCSDGNMTNDKYGYLQSLAYMLGVNSDPNYIMQYVATIMQNFDAMRSYFVWFWNYNQNKLPKDRNIMAAFVENMVQTCGLRPISQEQMKSVALSSPFINGFFSFLFGIFGLDWLALGQKGKAFFKVAFGVILFLIFGSIIKLPPTLHKWCLIIGIPLWFIKWIKDFAVNIPKQVRENNVKKACEELAKILFQR